MGSEKRKHKRLELNLSVKLGQIVVEGVGQDVNVDILDISETGIGFTSDKDLEIQSFFDLDINLWNGEKLATVIQIVRCQVISGEKHYGAVFVGLSELDALKIKIHELLESQKA